MMLAAGTFTFTGCDDSDVDPGGTATEGMSGTWDVTLYDLNADGTVGEAEADFSLTTYNTAANTNTEMWFNGLSGYESYGLPFQTKVAINYGAKTFGSTTAIARILGDDSKGTITITDGKILPNAAKNLHGMPNDSIVFDITYNNNSIFTQKLRVSGQRYTGFTE